MNAAVTLSAATPAAAAASPVTAASPSPPPPPSPPSPPSRLAPARRRPVRFRERRGHGEAARGARASYELVFPTAPYGGNLWILDLPGGKGEPTTDADFAADAIAVLDEVVAAQGPFYGILGYSQGAAFAPVYLSTVAEGTFEVALLFCGYLPTTHTGLMGRIDDAAPFGGMAALVWMSEYDWIISNDMTHAQAERFSSPTVLTSSSGYHAVPTSSMKRSTRSCRSSATTPPANSPPPPPPPGSLRRPGPRRHRHPRPMSLPVIDTRLRRQLRCRWAGVHILAGDMQRRQHEGRVGWHVCGRHLGDLGGRCRPVVLCAASEPAAALTATLSIDGAALRRLPQCHLRGGRRRCRAVVRRHSLGRHDVPLLVFLPGGPWLRLRRLLLRGRRESPATRRFADDSSVAPRASTGHAGAVPAVPCRYGLGGAVHRRLRLLALVALLRGAVQRRAGLL